jgi:branched-chain amino acid transport system ATP-binding protein
LDEPSLGLAPLIVAQIFEIVTELNKGGMTVLLVEQNARMALKISHRAYVLETGKITLQGGLDADAGPGCLAIAILICPTFCR